MCLFSLEQPPNSVGAAKHDTLPTKWVPFFKLDHCNNRMSIPKCEDISLLREFLVPFRCG